MVLGLLVTLIAAIAAFGVASLIRRNAARLGVIADVTARSSHTHPTPSGGGVGIVAGGTIAGAYAALGSPWPMATIVVLAVAVAAIGFADDRKPLPASLRLGAQILLTALAVWLAVPLTALKQQTGLPLPEVVLAAGAVIGSVYWLNLFNFMDGTDGLAASEAIFVTLGGVLLAVLRAPAGVDPGALWMLAGIAAASAGFLVLNWPPAKIFMGDAGSTYLGFAIALVALTTVAEGFVTLVQWAILTAAFVTDATVTLVRRLLLRERVFEAHRRHAYQVLSRRWGGHRPVALSYIGVNVVWLLPLAHVSALPGWALPALALAYVPLIGLALVIGAGAPEAAVSRR
jgi:Fuc2NAc and GlcNAc transferase